MLRCGKCGRRGDASYTPGVDPTLTVSAAQHGWLIAAAFATAALSGLAGAGGGTILVGVLFAAGIPPVLAVPLHAVVQFASNASRTLAYAKHVRWQGALIFCLGAVPAPFVVAPLLVAANPDWIRLIMAVFIMWALLPRLAFGQNWSDRGAMGAAGVLSGGVGAVVGATGLLIAPLFLRPGWSSRATIGNLALCQALGHLAKVVAFMVVGVAVWAYPLLLGGMVLGVIAGTAVGRWAHQFLPAEQFRLLFRTILVVLAVKLIVDAATGLKLI